MNGIVLLVLATQRWVTLALSSALLRLLTPSSRASGLDLQGPLRDCRQKLSVVVSGAVEASPNRDYISKGTGITPVGLGLELLKQPLEITPENPQSIVPRAS